MHVGVVFACGSGCILTLTAHCSPPIREHLLLGAVSFPVIYTALIMGAGGVALLFLSTWGI